MSRRTLLVLCGLLLINRVANATDACCAPPRCSTCIDSYDYGDCVEDRMTTSTLWHSEETSEMLTGDTKVPQTKTTTSTTLHEVAVKTRVCEPTCVTRDFAFPGCRLQERCVEVEVSFVEHEPCIDTCGCVHILSHRSPNLVVHEPEFYVRPVTHIVEASAATVACRDVETIHEFPCATTKCDSDDCDARVSVVGKKLKWTAERCSLPTGIVTLTTTPAVHVVPVTCPECPACPLHCVGCRYTPCCELPAIRPSTVPPSPLPPAAPGSPGPPPPSPTIPSGGAKGPTAPKTAQVPPSH